VSASPCSSYFVDFCYNLEPAPFSLGVNVRSVGHGNGMFWLLPVQILRFTQGEYMVALNQHSEKVKWCYKVSS
jgi:hypothetical protein